MMNNPYTWRAEVQDAGMFVGRVHEASEIGSFILGNQSVAIVGPRKIGKTSLMLHLMRPETRAALQIGREYLFVCIDCQALTNASYGEILAHLSTEMAVALRAQGFGPEPALKSAALAPTRSAFEAALRQLNGRGLRLALMLDEFEQLTQNPAVDVNFYNWLRSIAARLRVTFVTASARPLIELTYSERAQEILSSPFFNIFAPLFLSLFPETEARQLIRGHMRASGIPVSPQLEDFIYNLVGGHPLGLQVACFHAWGSPDDPGLVRDRTVEELKAHFEYYWSNLSPAELHVLRHLSEAALREPEDPALRVNFRDLVQKCLLVKSEGSYAYPSIAWAEFVSARRDASANTPPPGRPVQIVGSGGFAWPEDDSGEPSQR